mmetsp:Transcript_26971/g.4966  ORF Transcript_26971/g.4966 Transcript_26971/m.4966 type:complete len:80 (+) Transcript_26971:2164-2403(+)
MTVDETGVVSDVTDDGTNLTITGTSLPTTSDNFSIWLGGKECEVSSATDGTQIVCTKPIGRAGDNVPRVLVDSFGYLSY